MHPDIAYKNFLDKIYNVYKEKPNKFSEADTRAKIIDILLTECLGWDESNISREDHSDSGFTDYQLLYKGIPMLTLEAKKSGEYFDIPKTHTNRTYKITGAISSVSNLSNAMKQVRDYCSDLGCTFAAVSNGYQLVIFTAITIGRSWKDGSCLVFNSLDDIRDNFSIMWNMLSYENVTKGSLNDYLVKSKKSLNFKKVFTEIHNPDQIWSRNDLYIYNRPISKLIFSELLDEKQTAILKSCYVYGKASSLSDELQEYFKDKLPHFAESYKIKDIVQGDKHAGIFQKDYLKKIYDASEGALIVLVGGIGSGKSTFLHRFFKIVLSEKENMLWFYIDFRYAPLDRDKLEEYMLAQILDEWTTKYVMHLTQLVEDYGFADDKNDLKKYFTTLINLLHALKFSVTIIMDNVDQLPLDLQESIFLLSHHLTNKFKTATIVAMREETFVSSVTKGSLDAYDISKFHISSPNFLELLTKRIDFTIGFLNTDYVKTFFRDIPTEDLNKLKKFYTVLKTSLSGENEQSQKVLHFIDNISLGNMRIGLKMFSNFLESGNTNINEIFQKYDESGSYQLAYHQVVKAIMLGEHRYYSQDRSNIINLFDFDTSLTDSHFMLLRILNYLSKRDNTKSPIGRGYTSIDEIIDSAMSIFIPKEVIIDSLRRLLENSLIESDTKSKTDISNATYLTITHSGNYYLNHILSKNVYLDLVCFDTPISDVATYNNIKKYIWRTDIRDRVEKTESFVKYLQKAELEEIKNRPEYISHEFTNIIFTDKIVEEFNSEKELILSKYNSKNKYK